MLSQPIFLEISADESLTEIRGQKSKSSKHVTFEDKEDGEAQSGSGVNEDKVAHETDEEEQ